MFGPELCFGLEGNRLFPFELIDAPFDTGKRLGAFQTFKDELVAFSVLDYQRGSAIHREDERSLLLFKRPT
jgi:hypothetical protein